MRTNCTARRPDLTLEDTENKVIIVIDMACQNEMNKEEKRTEKIRNYQQLGGRMKKLKSDLKELFDNEKELDKTVYDMQKTVLWESESIIRKVLSGLLLT